jgi:hypothetical protein
MVVTLHVWRPSASASSAFEPLGQVLVMPGQTLFSPDAAPALQELVQRLVARPTLPFRAEKLRDSEDGVQILLQEIPVGPHEDDYGLALAQTITREAGYAVTFDETPPA